ncbi:HtaA domain-containing protein [Streptomyces sp. CA-251251]|uniref:HtaA domain-containing protein n=1 Tax=Streptomyces sp. CA-251251 TaxID=3240063 RepID=UPI003D914600
MKESFRAYVVGDIAKGRVTVSGGAAQAGGNGAFTFTDATGTHDTDAGTLTASFRGAVNFKGHESNGAYGLGLTLSNLKATLDGGTGELTADVDSLGTRTEDVVLADLDALVRRPDRAGRRHHRRRCRRHPHRGRREGLRRLPGRYRARQRRPLGDAERGRPAAGRRRHGYVRRHGVGTGTSGGTGGSATTGGSTVGRTGSTVGGAGPTTGGLTGGGSPASTGSDLPGPALGAAAGVAVALGAGAVLAARKRRSRA